MCGLGAVPGTWRAQTRCEFSCASQEPRDAQGPGLFCPYFLHEKVRRLVWWLVKTHMTLQCTRLLLSLTKLFKADSSYVPCFANKETESQRSSALKASWLGWWELGLKPGPALYHAGQGAWAWAVSSVPSARFSSLVLEAYGFEGWELALSIALSVRGLAARPV